MTKKVVYTDVGRAILVAVYSKTLVSAGLNRAKPQSGRMSGAKISFDGYLF